jgi:FkbM family methyltransferase
MGSAYNPMTTIPITPMEAKLQNRLRQVKAQTLWPLARKSIKTIVSNRWLRNPLNQIYNHLSRHHKVSFYDHFAKVFRTGRSFQSEGTWHLDLEDSQLVLPLEKGSYWLHWDLALSLLGHDIEVKETYYNLLRSDDYKPDIFLDVGANYGTHSILMLALGVDHTFTFEPNRSCHRYFLDVCKRNSLKPNLVPVAVGDRDEPITLTYPPTQPWLGVTNPDQRSKLDTEEKLVTEDVDQIKLDDWIQTMKQGKILLKIDTEGHEACVLRGMQKTLAERKPWIIFESHKDATRAEIFNLLTNSLMSIHNLPLDPHTASTPLSHEGFLSASATNFIARPTT